MILRLTMIAICENLPLLYSRKAGKTFQNFFFSPFKVARKLRNFARCTWSRQFWKRNFYFFFHSSSSTLTEFTQGGDWTSAPHNIKLYNFSQRYQRPLFLLAPFHSFVLDSKTKTFKKLTQTYTCVCVEGWSEETIAMYGWVHDIMRLSVAKRTS